MCSPPSTKRDCASSRSTPFGAYGMSRPSGFSTRRLVAASPQITSACGFAFSASSLAVMKRQVYEQLHVGLGAAELRSQQLMLESFERPDFEEGVQSFLEKRPPVWPKS